MDIYWAFVPACDRDAADHLETLLQPIYFDGRPSLSIEPLTSICRAEGRGVSMIRKIMIRNYRCFRSLDLDLNPTMNIVVGDNDAGKSTLLEAINLALTSRVNGRTLDAELSPHLINTDAAAEYAKALGAGDSALPPELIIDLFLDETLESAILRGTNNLSTEDAVGLRIRASLSQDFSEEYQAFIAKGDPASLVPTEYYEVEWKGFSGNSITARSVPATASLIDASMIRLQNGADYYLQGMIADHLDKSERVELARSYRSLRQEFTNNPAVQTINGKLATTRGEISDRELSLSIDISHRFTWESSLVPHLDELPFQYVGKGEQHTLKVLLALGRKLSASHVLLIEEPENHLAFATLNVLIAKIKEKCADRQIVMTTHSSFVLNKLGLDNLILLNHDHAVRIDNLPASTQDYFMKLSGYDTLRLVLAKRVILVEGPSDELVIQRAYLARHGKLPIEDGVDVINVRGLSFKRFLDIAVRLKRPTKVVTDNDGRPAADVEAGYAEYIASGFVSVHVGADSGGRTLEPQLLHAIGRADLNALLDQDFDTDDELLKYMTAHKTTCAVALFAADDTALPSYIGDAVQ
ncbi:MAG TPA: AAA family ATPase [Acidimicrobiales bacterium]|nr:AAA family ATPase [Acidimicrobiales bacterium]